MKRFVHALFAAALLGLVSVPASAASREELDAQVREAIGELYKHSSAAKELAGRSAGCSSSRKSSRAAASAGNTARAR